MDVKRQCICVVVGHVDHGKTSLVKALTGVDTDRLKEEKERGLSIQLGFASRRYGHGIVDFVDAPGHQDFIRATISGASGANAALLVVAATEGNAPQTVEHIQIIGLLGIEYCVVALNKVDTKDPKLLRRRAEEIETLFEGHSFTFRKTVPCSAKTGEGLDDLDKALNDMVGLCAPRDDHRSAFLPIDRVFQVPGAGTVVTGTLQAKPLELNDKIAIQPLGKSVSIRDIQVHNRSVPRANPYQRVALNLRNVQPKDVPSGSVVCAEPSPEPTSLVDVHVSMLPQTSRLRLRRGDEVLVYFGNVKTPAKVTLFGQNSIEAGQKGFARLKFPKTHFIHAGQRMILRGPSPGHTFGCATALDPAPAKTRVKTPVHIDDLNCLLIGDPAAIGQALFARDNSAVPVTRLVELARMSERDVRAKVQPFLTETKPGYFVPENEIARLEQGILGTLSDFHAAEPLSPMIAMDAVLQNLEHSDRELAAHTIERLRSASKVIVRGRSLALASFDVLAALNARQNDRLDLIESDFLLGGVKPSNMQAILESSGDDGKLLDLLIENGVLVKLKNTSLKQDVVFHQRALEDARETLRETFPFPSEFKVGEARRALGTTRKYIVPMLEYFDQCGWTRRQGDVRTNLN